MYMKRFIRNVGSKKNGDEVGLKTLTFEDIEESLRLWIIYEQAVLNGNFEKLIKIYRELNQVLQKLLHKTIIRSTLCYYAISHY